MDAYNSRSTSTSYARLLTPLPVLILGAGQAAVNQIYRIKKNEFKSKQNDRFCINEKNSEYFNGISSYSFAHLPVPQLSYSHLMLLASVVNSEDVRCYSRNLCVRCFNYCILQGRIDDDSFSSDLP